MLERRDTRETAMKLGPRTAHITQGGSDGWEVYYAAREMAGRGVALVNLTVGEPDIPTDRAILDAMHDSALAGHTGYTVGAGKRALREAIAARVAAQTGVPTTWENVIVTPGGQAALFAAHMVLLGEGDTGLHCDPYYATYPGTIRATGAAARAVPTRPEADFQPGEEAILTAAAGPRVRTLVVNSPNNPTGAIYSRATVEGIARAAEAADLWLISDEVYHTQVWQGEHVSPRALPGMAARTVVTGSMSKSHAMTGSRLGWIVAPPEVVEAVNTLATNTTYGVPGFIQDAGLFALNQGPTFEAKIAAPFRRRVAIAAAALEGANAVRMVPPGGGMFVMLDIRATGLSGRDFAARLLDEERIAVMPGESFGAAAAGHVRVAMRAEDGVFAGALGRLAAFAGRVAGGA
jgi:arginine:pyruvate transaminase